MGLLGYIGGGLAKGIGDAMVNKAKVDREAAITALAEANKRTDAATEQNYRTANIGQQGDIQSSLEDKRIGGEKDVAGINNKAAMDRTNVQEKGATTRTGMTEAGANTRNAATEAGANSRNAASVQAQKDVANIRAASYNHKTDAIASQYGGTGRPLTYNQALETARQAYKAQISANGPLYDDDGTAIPADKAIADIADKLMARQPASQVAPSPATVINPNAGFSGGGLLNPNGNSMPSLPVTPISPLTSAPSLSTPAGTSPGGDDGWIVKRISP